MLITTIYQMSNVIAKFHQDHKVSNVSNHEPTVTFQGGVSVSSNKRTESHGYELSDFLIIL